MENHSRPKWWRLALFGMIVGAITSITVQWLLPDPPDLYHYHQYEPISVLDLPECPSEEGVKGAASWVTGPVSTGRACVWDSGINNREWGGLYGKRWTVYAVNCWPWQVTNVREDPSNWICVEY